MSVELRQDREAFLRRLEERKDQSTTKQDDDALIWNYLKERGITSQSIDLKDIDESSYSLLKQWSETEVSNAKINNDDEHNESKMCQNQSNVEPLKTPFKSNDKEGHDQESQKNKSDLAFDEEQEKEKETEGSGEMVVLEGVTTERTIEQEDSAKQTDEITPITSSSPEMKPMIQKPADQDDKKNEEENEVTSNIRSLYENLCCDLSDQKSNIEAVPVVAEGQHNNDWHELVLQRLDENKRQMDRVEQKLDVLAQLVLSLSEKSTPNQIPRQDRQNSPWQTPTFAVDPPPYHVGAPHQQEQQPEIVGPVILPMFERFFRMLLSIPQYVFQSLQNSFPVRLVAFIRRQNHDEFQFRMDWFFCFKLVFMMVLFSNRHGNNPVKIGFLLSIAILSYLFQIGLISFFYRVLIKEGGLRRVWNHEENNDDGLPPPNERNNDEHPQRRRARDREMAVNPNDGLPPPVQQHQAQERNHQPIAQQNPNFIIRGNIHPRRDRQGLFGGFIDFVMDIQYFFGSFLLSLLPMWRPEPVRRNNNDNNEENDNGPPQNHLHQD